METYKKEMFKSMNVEDLQTFLKTRKFGYHYEGLSRNKKLDSKCNDWLLDVCVRELKSGQPPKENVIPNNIKISIKNFNKDIISCDRSYFTLRAKSLLVGTTCELCKTRDNTCVYYLATKLSPIYTKIICKRCFNHLHKNCVKYFNTLYHWRVKLFMFIQNLGLIQDITQTLYRLVLF